jgi:hypothetical protein
MAKRKRGVASHFLAHKMHEKRAFLSRIVSMLRREKDADLSHFSFEPCRPGKAIFDFVFELGGVENGRVDTPHANISLAQCVDLSGSPKVT